MRQRRTRWPSLLPPTKSKPVKINNAMRAYPFLYLICRLSHREVSNPSFSLPPSLLMRTRASFISAYPTDCLLDQSNRGERMTTTGDGTKAAEDHDSRKAFGLVAKDDSGVLTPFTFTRRKNGDNDVTVKVLYCGVCHSDFSMIKNEWRNASYPMVPGHEFVGVITETGRNVQKFKVGDRAGVGVTVNSCRSCDLCEQNLENYCPEVIYTYNSVDHDGTTTFGGYSNTVVVNQDFVLKFPENLPMDKGAPLLCAGITVYSPMKKFGLDQPGKHLGVAGLGGLGHVAVKFGKAFGMKVTVIDIDPKKKDGAIRDLGADDFLVITDDEQMQAATSTMDGIIDTVPVKHNLGPLLLLLKTLGKLVMVGIPEHPVDFPPFTLINKGKMVAGSTIGGLKEAQEMIDFAGKHNITAEIELIKADYVNEALQRLVKADVKYRFVIDIGNTLTPE